MQRHLYVPLTILSAWLALAMTARPAMALSHISALRSGDVIVAPVVVRAPLTGQDGAGPGHTAVIPVLMNNPHSPAEVTAYKDAMKELRAPADSRMLKGYQKIVSGLPLEETILAGIKQGAGGVSWVKGGNDVSLYRRSRALSVDAMKHMTASSGNDATVFIKPLVVFSPDFSHIYLLERVAVFAWGPVHPFFLGSRILHGDFLLLDTKPELKPVGVQGLAASQMTGENPRRARAAVWFANHGRRFMQAIKAASNNLAPALSSYLQGH